MEKFGLAMDNISGIRTTKGRISIGYVAFLACVFLPEITIPIACRAYVPSDVPGYESKISMAIATVKHFARQAKKANLSIAGMVVVFDSWYFAIDLCRTIDRYQMTWITRSKSNRNFFLADDKGNPTIKKKASELISSAEGKMKQLHRKRVWYRNIGRCYLPRYGWVYATVVYDPKRHPETFLLVSNNLEANGPWMIEHYYKRWQIETVIRNAKQSFGLPNFHMRHFSGICAHISVCMLNYLTFPGFGTLIISSLLWVRWSISYSMS